MAAVTIPGAPMIPAVNVPSLGQSLVSAADLAGIARPAIADFGEQVRQGRESALQQQLLAAQEQRKVAQEARAVEEFGLRKQQLQGNLSDAQFNEAVKKMSLIGTISDPQVRSNLFSQVKGTVQGNPLLENMVQTVEQLPPDRTGKFFQDLNTFGNRVGILKDSMTEGAGRVLSSEILDDGTIIQSTQLGPRVWSATGEQLTGQAAAQAIDKARKLKVNEQIRLAQAKAEETGKKLSPTMIKILDNAQTEAFNAQNRSGSLGTLADDFSKIRGTGGGVRVGISEFLKDQLGTTDEVSQLRRDFRGIRASEAMQNLPPGPASDKDIALALGGFPLESAPPEQIESFLRGAQKAAAVKAVFQEHRANYISQHGDNRGLIADWRKNREDLINAAISNIPDGPLEMRRKAGITASSSGQAQIPFNQMTAEQRRAARQQPAAQPTAAPGQPVRMKFDAQGNMIQ